MGVLDRFCAASGQLVSRDKTSIYFSKNVSPRERRELAGLVGFREVTSLGKYLGVPLTGRVPRRADFQYLIDKVSAKLGSWKAKQLSLAGRITLAKSVIEAIPLYPMISNVIPNSCLREIQRLQRGFIWGEDAEHRRIHYVNWNILPLPKSHGGLGLRDLSLLNDACIMKTGWALRQGCSGLWTQVLKGKYGQSQVAGNIVAKDSDSSLWKQIVRVWNKLPGLEFWSLGNGTAVNIWNDSWIEPGLVLRNFDISIPADMEHFHVNDLVGLNGEWDFSVLQVVVPADILGKVKAVLPPSDADGEDQRLWA